MKTKTRTSKTAARRTSNAAARRPKNLRSKAPAGKASAPAPKTKRKAVTGRSSIRVPTVKVFTKREAWSLFNRTAQKYLGMSGKEFVETWNRGDFDDNPDTFPVMTVAMMLPLIEVK